MDDSVTATGRPATPLRIAVCGTRGIPACYGGFETFAEELSTRLVGRGHSVIVYGRTHVIAHKEDTYRGVRIRLLGAPRHKYLETPVHTLRSFIDLLWHPVDVILLCNAANSPFVWLPRLRGYPVAVNVDGVERKRAKWSSVGKLWYRIGEIASVLFASRVVADADVIQEYYRSSYRCDSTVIRYGYRKGNDSEVDGRLSGAPLPHTPERKALFDELGIEPGSYLLYVSRLEPENNAHRVIRAYEALPAELKNMPLVIVGDAPYAAEYIASLREIAGSSVRFAGSRFGDAYTTLQLGCYAYIQATEVGGTHPALVEAMGYGSCIIANDVPEHREVIADTGSLYEKNSEEALSRCLAELIHAPDRVRELRRKAAARARALFDWEHICDQYEAIFLQLTADKAGKSGFRAQTAHGSDRAAAGDFK